MTQLYNRWVVRSVRYELSLLVTAGAYGSLSAVPNNLSTAFGTSEEDLAAETPMAQTIYAVSGCPGPAQVISGKVDPWKLNGVPLQQYLTDDRFSGTIGASPSELLILHTVATSSSGTSTGFIYSVRLFFDVEFYDPLSLAGS